MFLCDDFVFLHMPKTAGTFVTRVLAELYGQLGRPFEAIEVGRYQLADPSALSKHGFRDSLPAVHQEKPLLLTVRNPFRHYDSIYRFGWWKTHPNSLFLDVAMQRRYPRYPELTFDEFVQASQDWSLSPKADAALLAGSAIGPLTRQYVRYTCRDADAVLRALVDAPEMLPPRDGALQVLHTEQIADELHRFLRDVVGLPGEALEGIANAAQVNVTPGASPAATIGKASRRRIQQRERLLFRLFPEYAPPHRRVFFGLGRRQNAGSEPAFRVMM